MHKRILLTLTLLAASLSMSIPFLGLNNASALGPPATRFKSYQWCGSFYRVDCYQGGLDVCVPTFCAFPD